MRAGGEVGHTEARDPSSGTPHDRTRPAHTKEAHREARPRVGARRGGGRGQPGGRTLCAAPAPGTPGCQHTSNEENEVWVHLGSYVGLSKCWLRVAEAAAFDRPHAFPEAGQR